VSVVINNEKMDLRTHLLLSVRANRLGFWFLFRHRKPGGSGHKWVDRVRTSGYPGADLANGEALFGPAIAHRLTKFFNNPVMDKQSAFPELTSREFEVLELIAQAYNNHEIAKKLNISIKTVSNHISNIFSKLQVSDRSEAIFKARDAGLGKSS
jgi:DNA-binding CsgD family transcriptional regulator